LNHSSTSISTQDQYFLGTVRQMGTYSERLKEAMDRAGATTTSLAKELKLSYQAVTKVLGSDTSAFNASNHDKAALLLGVSSSWLANGTGPMLPQDGPPLQFTPAALNIAEAFDALPKETDEDQNLLELKYWKILALIQSSDGTLAIQPVRTPAARPTAGRPRMT
jgi:hypothetical protein